MDSITQFLGRFHILILHLPIGILMLVAISMLLIKIQRTKFANHLKPTLPFLLFSGTISAVFASVLGYLLSLNGGYTESALDLHFWSAIVLSIIAALATFLSYKKKNIFHKFSHVLAVLLLILLTLTGHAGGNLTHGDTYLFEHGPDFVKKAVGMELELAPPKSLDEAQFYGHIIKPILRTSCVSCHSKSKREGDLDMSTYASLMKGGTKLAIQPNDITTSEIYKRITLPHDNKKFMPTEGKKPLSDEQIKLMAIWINSGAQQETTVTELNLSTEEHILLEKATHFSTHKVLISENIDVTPLTNNGFYVNILPSGYGLDITHYPKVGNKLNKDILESLLPFKNQIVWLKLSRNKIDNRVIPILAEFTELKKLSIDGTEITDITALKNLTNLEFLNIYNTPITNENQLISIKDNNPKLTHIVK